MLNMFLIYFLQSLKKNYFPQKKYSICILILPQFIFNLLPTKKQSILVCSFTHFYKSKT